MLAFGEISIEDRETINPYLQRDGVMMSERCFPCLYMWADRYMTRKCLTEDILFLKSALDPTQRTYYMPLGADVKKAITLLHEDAAAHQMPYQIVLITPQERAEIERLFPGQYTFTEQRDEYDYIYDAQEFIALKGRKYHSKRNYINRFQTEYAGRWHYRELDPAQDGAQLAQFLQEWARGRDEQALDDYRHEYTAINLALTHYKELGMMGGVLFVGEQMIGFTMAAAQNDQVIDIIIEKARADIPGAYPMVTHCFAEAHCAAYQYINREEDMGIEGLRQAKLSYNPCMLTEKYRAVLC